MGLKKNTKLLSCSGCPRLRPVLEAICLRLSDRGQILLSRHPIVLDRREHVISVSSSVCKAPFDTKGRVVPKLIVSTSYLKQCTL
jgi:hypothetical protein